MARRGKPQARRSGGSGGLPGWMWLIIGAVLALVLVMAAPKYFKSSNGSEDGFFRPRPNPDAQPSISALDEISPPPARPAPRPLPAPVTEPDFDFYTALPAQETALSDAELSAHARAESPASAVLPPPTPPSHHPDAATPATPAPSRTTAAGDANARYLLQAGAFADLAEADALKAQIAFLGLQARIESGMIDGKPVHRVRLGPYASAAELETIKQRLGNGGLSALAVRVE